MPKNKVGDVITMEKMTTGDIGKVIDGGDVGTICMKIFVASDDYVVDLADGLCWKDSLPYKRIRIIHAA